MRKSLALLMLALPLAACASTPQQKIEDRLIAIGIPENRADCMGDQLKERLKEDDLKDLAKYLTSLSKSESPGEALDAMLKIDNPRAVGAITASAISCAFAPKK